MIVSSTDLKTNLGKYLDLLDKEDIIITRNGHKIGKIIKAEDDNLTEIQSLYGLLAGTELSKMTDKEVKSVIYEERNRRNECLD